jgi:hypothetical protein
MRNILYQLLQTIYHRFPDSAYQEKDAQENKVNAPKIASPFSVMKLR